MKVSTGLRNKLLDTGSLKAILAGGFVDLYSGTVPLQADDAPGGDNVKLCRVSLNSTPTGITFDVAASGTLAKNPAEIWAGTILAGGVATYYRHVAPGDTAASSATEPRLQGNIANVGADMNFSSTTLVAAATKAIDFYVIALASL